MDFASPAVELLGFSVTLLALLVTMAASLVFLREKTTGAWLMLIGSVLSLISLIPKGIEQVLNYYSRNGYEPPEITGLLYYTIWNWLPTTAAFLFSAGLLLTAFQRRGFSKRIKELENILSTQQSGKK